MTAMTAMTAFVESCVETVADSAVQAERRARGRGRPRALRLLAALAGKKNILVTAHQHPDPDALASAMGVCTLITEKMPGTKATLSIKGQLMGGMNEGFVRISNLKLAPWDDAAIPQYDAIVLVDTQPQFPLSPLPPGVTPTAVIDHHRGRGMKPNCPFVDIRPEVGASASIVFSYFMELEVPIRPDLAATLLFAIETDLAGLAGTPGELDNIALSSLTLLADPRKLYQMRYVDLPQSYFRAYAEAIGNAVWQDGVLMTHLKTVDSLEKPAVMGDFLLRFDKVGWALVTAEYDGKLVLSLRTQHRTQSAADAMKKIVQPVGQGGGHKTKAGGFVDISKMNAAEVEELRQTLWRRYLKAIGVKAGGKPQKLVP
jgi:nanoRNase/pAp phosphatase (c-di-AMP/oligoRNAs hydrolase)